MPFENKFVHIVRTCISSGLFEYYINLRNPLVCCKLKNLTNIVLDQYMRNRLINYSVGKKWADKKRNIIKRLFVLSKFNHGISFSSLTFIKFGTKFDQP